MLRVKITSMMPKDIKLIIGLGNPGDKYKNTYHNAGLLFVDHLSGVKCRGRRSKTTFIDPIFGSPTSPRKLNFLCFGVSKLAQRNIDKPHIFC